MINEFRDSTVKLLERQFVSCLWNNPFLYDKLITIKLTRNSFISKSVYILYKIGSQMYNDGIIDFDDISVEYYLVSHEITKAMYDEIDGNKKIDLIRKMYRREFDFDSILDSLVKYISLREMEKNGIINEDHVDLIEKLSRNKTTFSQAKKLMTYLLEESLSIADNSSYEEFDLTGDAMREAAKETREGDILGIDIYNSPILTERINGLPRGELIYLGMKSGVGKSNMLRNMFLPSIIDSGEKCIVLVNEESKRKWIMNVVVSLLNSRIISDKDKMVLKKRVFLGQYDDDVQESIDKAIEWYEENYKSTIKIVVLKRYKYEDVEKILTKYSKFDFRYVLFDTFKPDSDGSKDKQRWQRFSEMSGRLYDLVKPENLNMCAIATVQLALSDGNTRFLSMKNIGKSKEIVEVADTILLGRNLYADEYSDDDDDGGGFDNSLSVIDSDGDVYYTSKKKDYILLFLAKSRNGSKSNQILFEMDYDYNIIKEVGMTTLIEDAGKQ